MMILGALFETMGLALVMPFISLVMDRSIIYTDSMIHWLYEKMGMQSENEFLIAAGIMYLCCSF